MGRRNELERTRDQFLDDKAKRGGSGNYRRNAGRLIDEFIEHVAVGCPTYDDLQVPEAYRDAGSLVGADRWSLVDVDHCAAFARLLRKRVWEDEIAGSTAGTYYAYIRAWGEWAVDHEFLEKNPAAKQRAENELPTGTPRRSTQQMWTPEQRTAVLDATRTAAEGAFDTEPRGQASIRAARDRALAALLAFSGVRGGEVLRDPHDDRRSGATWGDLAWPTNDHPDGVRVADTEHTGTLVVLGKSGEMEPAPVLEQAMPALRAWYRLLDPPSPDWPLFPTLHAPTLYGILEDSGGVDVPLLTVRDAGTVPPASTTTAGRQVMRRLTERADIDLDGDASYLEPHGGRRGVGNELYQENPRLAQDVLRHQNIGTTQEAYRERQVESDAEEASELLKD
jgi:integrase